ncbi:hypothetical protein V6x_02120 [Gimesia chilikensis]|uniref:Uncharacterized protein n=1 Tax=Gimesia chilikensis TaxID=2605989 RepID=A0A517W5K3_9PLAN|nr:DUF1559 domain-containing protein [Gimesia chilikensis]QDU00537.1 hypothetical protein V6x_02120 [Gimesia chilikensis]
MANWYVKRGDQTAGPLTRERLIELAAQGKVQESDLVREGEAGEFRPAGQIPGLLPAETVSSGDFDFEQTSSASAGPKKNNSTLILLIAILGGGGILVVLVLVALLLPAVEQAREAARRSASKNNLKLIGLAMHNYHDTFRVFTPGGTTNVEGKPNHSWQTFILPFMDQAVLYNRIDMDQPWTTPENRKHFTQVIPDYLHPSVEETVSPDGLALSHYIGNELLLETNGNTRFRDITDGASTTIMAIESGEGFKPWGDPTNIDHPANVMREGRKTSMVGGNHVLLSDGAVRFVSENIDPDVLKAMSTPNGGEAIGEF